MNTHVLSNRIVRRLELMDLLKISSNQREEIIGEIQQMIDDTFQKEHDEEEWAALRWESKHRGKPTTLQDYDNA